MSTINTFEATVLAAAEAEFLRDFTDTAMIAVPGGLLGPQFAGGLLPLVQVRALLLERGAVEDKDAAWRYVVERSRRCGGAWTLAAVGMAAPMLKRTAAGAAARFPEVRKDDLAAEVLAGFLEHLAVMNLQTPGICLRLRWAAWRAVLKAGRRQSDLPSVRIEPGSMPPAPPCSHPDVVLARAERAGVITAAEADLIGMTRLDEVSLAEAAESLGITANAAKIRRQKAEARLVAFLTGRPIPARRLLKHTRTRVAVSPAMAAA